MNGEFNSGHSEESVYAVNAEWFRAWQRFVRGDNEGTAAAVYNLSEAMNVIFKAVRIVCNTVVSNFKFVIP